MSRALAIALGYRGEVDLAPRVVATGGGALAQRILAIAERSGVPRERDAALAELLSPLEPGDEIPQELYIVVARVFAYLERVARRGAPPPDAPRTHAPRT